MFVSNSVFYFTAKNRNGTELIAVKLGAIKFSSENHVENFIKIVLKMKTSNINI